MEGLKRAGRRADIIISSSWIIRDCDRPVLSVGNFSIGIGSVTLSTPQTPSNYQELVRRMQPPPRKSKTVEGELDALITLLNDRKTKAAERAATVAPDPVQVLRDRTIQEFIPIFVEIVEKYSKSGVAMEMDASNLLQGGREIKFEFAVGEYRSVLQGTVTTEGIAFHESRYAPDIRGELTSGPMLRLRNLTGDVFRDFVCERLTILVRTALRR